MAGGKSVEAVRGRGCEEGKRAEVGCVVYVCTCCECEWIDVFDGGGIGEGGNEVWAGCLICVHGGGRGTWRWYLDMYLGYPFAVDI